MCLDIFMTPTVCRGVIEPSIPLKPSRGKKLLTRTFYTPLEVEKVPSFEGIFIICSGKVRFVAKVGNFIQEHPGVLRARGFNFYLRGSFMN